MPDRWGRGPGVEPRRSRGRSEAEDPERAIFWSGGAACARSHPEDGGDKIGCGGFQRPGCGRRSKRHSRARGPTPTGGDAARQRWPHCRPRRRQVARRPVIVMLCSLGDWSPHSRHARRRHPARLSGDRSRAIESCPPPRSTSHKLRRGVYRHRQRGRHAAIDLSMQRRRSGSTPPHRYDHWL